MIIRVGNIPVDGLDFHLTLAEDRLSERANAPWTTLAGEQGKAVPTVAGQQFSFPIGAEAHLKIYAEGTTVVLKGRINFELSTSCSRCLKDINRLYSIPIDMVYKPHRADGSRRGDVECDDVALSYYEGDSVDTSQTVEEIVMLSVPFTLTCEDVGLPECELSLSGDPDEVDSSSDGRFPFRILQQMKIH